MANIADPPRRDSKGEMFRRDTDYIFGQIKLVLTNLAGQLSQVLAAGNAITLTLGASTLTIAVSKIPASADAAAQTSSAVVGTAGGTYTSNEQNILNAVVTQLDNAIADITAIRSSLNDLKAKARTAGHLHT